ncbi:hypothetical protein CAEBREN_22199 [Caenorhabditis brenneri]|uniref:Peptidase A2 domain-containing protein n=1 Tax=Caenorhabditis brenneri TaxID=135651 RepID=G0PJ17_CAEBE|nr:hypothetical protein CAEBREN_22199 [Caenorhabditis brenneri]
MAENGNQANNGGEGVLPPDPIHARVAPARNGRNPITFKDIKQASEAIQAVLPKFKGESSDEIFGEWCRKFTMEANSLNLGHQLTALVFPRLLDGRARLKYQTLTAEEQANYGTAVTALGDRLRSQGSRSKAMTDLAKIKKKESESIIAFAKRVEAQVNVAYPRLLLTQKNEIAINRFVDGLPFQIRKRLLEMEGLERMATAIERAERIAEINEEEERETVNLIRQIKKSDDEAEIEMLQEEIKKLEFWNEKLQSRGNQGNRYSNSYEGQRNRGFERQPYNPRGRSCPPQREGWNINRTPRGTGINFLMVMTIMALITQATAIKMQICPVERSGEYFYPPTTTVCESDKTEQVIKTDVELWTEYGASQKIQAYRCTTTKYDSCYQGFFDMLFRNPTISNVETSPMSKELCELAMRNHKIGEIILEAKGENLFQSTPDKEIYMIQKGFECPQKYIYTLEIGEIASPDGEIITSSLGDTSGCKAENGECVISTARLMWDTAGIEKFCKYTQITTTEAYVTKSKVAISELQMALQISPNQTVSGFQMCSQNLAVATNNGFVIAFKESNGTKSFKDIFEAVKTKRVKRHLLRNKSNETLIHRLFGPNVNAQNFTLFAVDPPTDYRIIHELKRYDVSFSQVKHQWANYDLPNKQIAMLRAIKEGELRKQYIRELRQDGKGIEQADLIKRLEHPTELFDQDLIEEFGPTRMLSDSEKRDWDSKGDLDETQRQRERIQAGQNYVQSISAMSMKATENRENAQLNSRVQFVADKIIESNYQEFNNVYRKLCELQNTQIEITRTLLIIDPTLGMRTLLKRDDIVAKRAGEVYMVNQCREIEAEEIHYDHKINGTCYINTPVTVKNKTWFIAPGTQKDLIQENTEVACGDVALAIYKDLENNWRSKNGIANVRNVPINIMKTMERLNLTLSAQPVFGKLEDLDNPTMYLATWANVLANIRQNQYHLVKGLQGKGIQGPGFTDILEKGADKVASISVEIRKSIEKGAEAVKDTAITVIKTIVIPIVLVITLGLAIWTGLKIYYGNNISRKVIVEMAKVARAAPPMVRSAMRRMRPEINNIQLGDFDEDEPTEMQTFDTKRKHSTVTIPDVYSIINFTGKYRVPRVTVQINKEDTIALIDTGASISLITDTTVRRIDKEAEITKTNEYARAANGDIMYFIGKITLTIKIGNKHALMKFFIVKEAPEQCILGMDFIHEMNKQNFGIIFNPDMEHISIGNTELKLLTQMECREVIKKQNEVTFAKNKMKDNLPFIQIELDGVPVVTLLDPRSSVSIITERMVYELNLQNKVKPINGSARVANRTEIKFIGQIDVTVTIGETSISLEMRVTENEETYGTCLLGFDFFKTLTKKSKLLAFNIADKVLKTGNTSVKVVNPYTDQQQHSFVALPKKRELQILEKISCHGQSNQQPKKSTRQDDYLLWNQTEKNVEQHQSKTGIEQWKRQQQLCGNQSWKAEEQLLLGNQLKDMVRHLNNSATMRRRKQQIRDDAQQNAANGQLRRSRRLQGCDPIM